MNGISTLIKETPQNSSRGQGILSMNPEVVPSSDTHSSGPLTLDFPDSRTLWNKIAVYKPPSL